MGNCTVPFSRSSCLYRSLDRQARCCPSASRATPIARNRYHSTRVVLENAGEGTCGSNGSSRNLEIPILRERSHLRYGLLSKRLNRSRNLSRGFRLGPGDLPLRVAVPNRSRGCGGKEKEKERVDRSAAGRTAARGAFVRARLASASAWKDSGAQWCAERPLRSAPLSRGAHKTLGGRPRLRPDRESDAASEPGSSAWCRPVPGGPRELACSTIDVSRPRHCAHGGTPGRCATRRWLRIARWRRTTSKSDPRKKKEDNNRVILRRVAASPTVFIFFLSIFESLSKYFTVIIYNEFYYDIINFVTNVVYCSMYVYVCFQFWCDIDVSRSFSLIPLFYVFTK